MCAPLTAGKAAQVDPSAIQNVLEADCRGAETGLRLWVTTRLAATLRVYLCASADGRNRVQTGSDITTAAGVPEDVTVAAPLGFVFVEYRGGVGGTEDFVDLQLLAV